MYRKVEPASVTSYGLSPILDNIPIFMSLARVLPPSFPISISFGTANGYPPRVSMSSFKALTLSAYTCTAPSSLYK